VLESGGAVLGWNLMWSAMGLGSFTETTCGCLVCVEVAVTTGGRSGQAPERKRERDDASRGRSSSPPPHVEPTAMAVSGGPKPWLESSRE
jgi:hypothetical protein